MSTATESPKVGTAEWLEARRHVVSGTDISAIAGLNPWRTPFDIYCEKRGLVEPQPENEAMKMGKLLEPVVLDLYEQRTGYQTEPGRFTIHPLHSWAGGTPDALTAVVAWSVVLLHEITDLMEMAK